jgi:hypothetical protein
VNLFDFAHEGGFEIVGFCSRGVSEDGMTAIVIEAERIRPRLP